MSTVNQPGNLKPSGSFRMSKTMRIDRPVAKPNEDPSLKFDRMLLDVSTANQNQQLTREAFRRVSIEATKAVGACHVIRDDDGNWFRPNPYLTGRVPSPDQFESELGVHCEKAFAAPGVQTVVLDKEKNIVALLSGVRVAETDPEVLMVVLPSAANLVQAVPTVERIVSALQLWLKSESANRINWQLNSLAMMSELVSQIETSQTVKKASEDVVNEMVRELKVANAALAVLDRKGKLKLTAVAGTHKVDKTSRSGRDYKQALRESITRDQAGVFPAMDQDNNHLLMSHKQLAASIHNEAVYSQPLITAAGETVGGWLFTGTKTQLHNPEFGRFIDTVSPKIASSLQLLHRAETNRLMLALEFIKRKTTLLTRLMIPTAIIAFCLLMMIPMTYRVRCNGTTQPVSKRFAVAPFDGLIVSGHAEPGDVVKKNQVLAEIDGRSILWELSGVTAQRRQSSRQREMELSKGNIPETFLAELENERLTSQEKILKFKKGNLKVKSPIDGVVLSGSLERAEAASITTGQVLFEIGPLKPMKVEIAIPSEDITHVKQGQTAKIWIQGQEDQPLEGTISRIHPRSETRDARNVFVAEIEFPNEDQRLRPGMKGKVRLDCDQHSLGWCLFHKPVNYLRARLTWW